MYKKILILFCFAYFLCFPSCSIARERTLNFNMSGSKMINLLEDTKVEGYVRFKHYDDNPDDKIVSLSIIDQKPQVVTGGIFEANAFISFLLDLQKSNKKADLATVDEIPYFSANLKWVYPDTDYIPTIRAIKDSVSDIVLFQFFSVKKSDNKIHGAVSFILDGSDVDKLLSWLNN